MPGPSNTRRNRKTKAKRNLKLNTNSQQSSTIARPPSSSYESDTPSSPSPEVLRTPSPSFFELPPMKPEKPFVLERQISQALEDVLCQEPFIYDPGNGPRVRGARLFISSFFAQPPSLDDPLCAEFAQQEVLEMLYTILPEETALILWYNKSRSKSRVCPACQRLYRLGEVLADHLGEKPSSDKPLSPQLLREQEISGICSPVCFILASFNYPGAIKSTWGRMVDEIDDEAWALLNGPGEGAAQGNIGQALGMLVKMTRLHDLGLAQLCFDGDELELLKEAESQLENLVLV